MPLTTIPLKPKNPGGPLRVMILGRISTVHQNEENIEASYRYAEERLRQLFTGEIEIKHLGEQASGMRTDRPTIIEAEEEIATGEWDLVLAEDLSRIYRNPRHQFVFVQDAVDFGTRVICFGDNLDTADENWEVTMGAAVLRHGLHIPDTRRRVKRTATHAFHRGGMVQKLQFGFRKLTKEEAASGQFGPKDLRIAKVPELTDIIHKMRDLILAGMPYRAIADRLNDEAVLPGPYCTSRRWASRSVVEVFRNPLLSGTRTFRKCVSMPIFRTGRHRTIPNPEQPETEYYPELAHLTPEEHAEVLAVMDARLAEHPRHRKKFGKLFKHRPRSSSLFPGQLMRCGICGELLYWISPKQLQCRSARSDAVHRCWNHVQVMAEQVQAKVMPWFLEQARRCPEFWESFVESAWQEYQSTRSRSDKEVSRVDDRILDLEARAANLVNAVEQGGDLSILVAKLRDVQASLEKASSEKQALLDCGSGQVALPTREEFVARIDAAVLELAKSSMNFAALLRPLFAEFVIYPVQALDTDLVRPRARVRLCLTPAAEALPDGSDVAISIDACASATFDLFDPAVHIQHALACVAAKDQHPENQLRTIATRLGINYMTVKRALDYAKLMQAEGTGDDPYRVLTSEPANASRWRDRVRNADSQAS